jgi:cytochrome c oxidase assembly protein subunit 15
MYDWYSRLLYVAAALAITVVVLGAWVRLTDAGLGCPDWPGCYGHLLVPAAEAHRDAAEAAFPGRPLVAAKAWHEMIHRYAATSLGLCIVAIAGLAVANRRSPRQPVLLPLLLLGTVVFQGLLGMWTVTLLVKPLIVMGHLLGGLSTLGLAFWLILEHRRRPAVSAPRGDRRVAGPALAALLVLVGQIALGGWTSSNYAALACPDLPTCNGEWWPHRADFAEGFVLWRGLGVNYEGGVLDAPARVAIHFTHRLGALVTFLVVLFTGLHFLRRGRTPDERGGGALVIAAVVLQVVLGISVVWFGLPLWVATAHNGGAALLLLSLINLNNATSRAPASRFA